MKPPLPKPTVYRVTWNADDGSIWTQYHDASDPLPDKWDDDEPDLIEGFFDGEQVRAYADTCTAALSARVAELERQVAQLTAERDEWARKAQEWRHKYAELRYPGMTQEVKALDAAIDAAMKEQT